MASVKLKNKKAKIAVAIKNMHVKLNHGVYIKTQLNCQKLVLTYF